MRNLKCAHIHLFLKRGYITILDVREMIQTLKLSIFHLSENYTCD